MKQNAIIFVIGGLVLSGFAVSVIAGFNMGQTQGIAVGRHVRDHTGILEKVTMGLNLSAEQRAQVDPFIIDAGPQLSAIEADARKKKYGVVDNTLAKIRPLLTPEQQRKLDELQKAREELHAAKDKVHQLTAR
ncbi:MAG TPA: hypothetical protein VIU85_00905 [Chthoniobacterales bacterium]